MTPRFTLSTASVFPESTVAGFEMAARLGFDGVELMVMADPVSQTADDLERLRDFYQVPVTSIHAPCLLISQRIWGSEPWPKLTRSVEVAERLGSRTVVIHPPFRWQRDYARGFVQGIDDMCDETEIKFGVENMYPWRAAGRNFPAYSPGWDVRDDDYRHTTLDLSHTSVAGIDAVEVARDLGERLVHVHLADGTGSSVDEHLVPGRGEQPCAEVLQLLAATGFDGDVVIEISTRRAANRDEREADLVESLAFARTAFSGSGASVSAEADGTAE